MSASHLPQIIDGDAPIFVISVAAQLAAMHPQTLRTYDRMGLVSPQRTSGRGRRYSARDITKLRMIQHLSQEEGVNLEGIRRILELEGELEQLRYQVRELNELLSAARAAPPGFRVFAADPLGGVRIAGTHTRTVWSPPKALPARRSRGADPEERTQRSGPGGADPEERTQRGGCRRFELIEAPDRE